MIYHQLLNELDDLLSALIQRDKARASRLRHGRVFRAVLQGLQEGRPVQEQTRLRDQEPDDEAVDDLDAGSARVD